MCARKDDDDDDDDDIVAEADEYERNGDDMSHLIHKRRLLRDGCDLFDLDRTERRRGITHIIYKYIIATTNCLCV